MRPSRLTLLRLALAPALGLATAAALAAPARPAAAPAAPTPPPLPGPATGAPAGDPVARNGACAGCHASIAAEWEGSGHQRAYEDKDFRASLAREPLPFCRGCHAPEADPRGEPSAERAHLGVACVSCHSPAGASAVHRAPRAARTPSAAHEGGPLVASAAFAAAGGCAGCHEFAFPDGARRAAPLLMQQTISEGARPGVAEATGGATCADCHMPTVDGHRSHRFAVRSEDLRAALQATAVRAGKTVTITLAARGVGHAFPTGDLFRRLVLVLETGGTRRAIPLARAWTDRSSPNGLLRQLAADTRLTATPVSFPVESAEAVTWTVRYERAASRTDPAGRVPVALFGAEEIARGVVPAMPTK